VTEVATVESADVDLPPRRDVEASATGTFDERYRFAANLARANMLPAHLRGKPADVLYAMELAESLGVHHMQAFTSIHVIEGKPSASAELCRALILRAGHRFDIAEMTPERCSIIAARRDRPGNSVTFTYTIEQAQRAGLASKDNWKKHPHRMLLARCTSDAAAAMFPDETRGMGVIGADDEDAVTFADPAPTATPAPSTLTEKVRAARGVTTEVVIEGQVINTDTGELPLAADAAVEDPPYLGSES
jgi:hypothetical protein